MFWWILYLIFVIPASIGVVKGVFSGSSDAPPSRIWASIQLVLGIILSVMAFSDLTKGIFTSLKTFCLFLTKAIFGYPLLANGIIKFIFIGIRNKWTARMKTVLDGDLGRILKKYLPNNSSVYTVDNESIVFIDNYGTDRILYFKDVGYEDIPPQYANVICEWIKYNIVYNSENYYIKRRYYEEDVCISGTSDRIETTRTVTGYESHIVKGETNYATNETTTGYELIHKTIEQPKTNLKKW